MQILLSLQARGLCLHARVWCPHQTLLLILLLLSPWTFAQVTITKVLTENSVNPIGLDTETPRFSWVMASEKRNVAQSAYQIKVALSESDLQKESNLVWNSGRVSSNQSVFVAYQGSPLKSGTRYFWQVKVWDNQGKASAWSPVVFWQSAFFKPEQEFKAQWITPGFEEDQAQRPSPLFRKEFKTATKKVARATVYITAHGMYEAELNGQRIGDAYFTPGWTSYQKRLQYQAYDVTTMLKSGTDNALGVTLGSGWYRGFLAWGDKKDHYGQDIALLLQLDILYTDGSQESILSDKSWKTSTGPILNSEIYDGEMYDSRKEIPSWSQAAFDDHGWSAAKEADFPKNILIATYNEPIRKHESFKPRQILTTPEGDQVLDFGQNLVGWVEVTLSGKSGDKLELYHTEVLDKKGNFYTENLRAADQKNTFILNGKPNQLLRPHFTFQGFRYVKVVGFPGVLKPDNFTTVALYSDMMPTGDFSCSHPLLNQLQKNIQWGQKGNFLDVPTDCPQRDERLGWTGDAQAFFRTAAYNMNVHNFFAKWLKDVAADQLPTGSVPFVVPNVLGPQATGSAGWADASTIIPWEMYLLYGDKKVLEDQYSSMKAWVGYIRSQSKDDLWKTGFHFGDWLFYIPGDDRDGRSAVTDKYLIAQCFYAYSTQLLIHAARVLGKKEDITEYTDLLQKIKTAFRQEYMTSTGRLVSGTQTAYVLALHFDMLPEELRAQAAQRLVDNIKSYNDHLTTGFLGTPYLCHVLSRFGYEDVAYTLLMQKTYPSWLYPVTMGATTIWERWDGIKPDSTFQTPSMNSYNHYAYGAIGDWMYRNITGIQADAQNPGYQQFIIKPILGGGLNDAQATLKTYYGTIRSAWKKEGKTLTQEIGIPVNSRADIYLTASSLESVTEGGKALNTVKELEVLGVEDGYVRLKAGSGTYKFSIVLE
ncbi:MAG: family 78 glycoside hydrolase catalytic domain [Microscillaceae bacterium]|nr:family 78 glycoside hydrolase catalytic domain [Microscillaceae bacterium]